MCYNKALMKYPGQQLKATAEKTERHGGKVVQCSASSNLVKRKRPLISDREITSEHLCDTFADTG